jgi:hypothetical protein
MKRVLTITVLVFMPGVLLASANAYSSNSADDPLANPYYPLQVGNTWEYLSGGKKIVVKVAAHEKIDDQLCARVETDSGARPVSEHLTVKEGGIYRVRANGQDIKPPFLVLKLPPAKGESWNIDSNIQNFPVKGKLTEGEEKLKVGKTQYDTVSVKSSEMVMGGKGVTMEAWYAKDVGMVKQHFRMPEADYDIVLELSTFTPGKEK